MRQHGRDRLSPVLISIVLFCLPLKPWLPHSFALSGHPWISGDLRVTNVGDLPAGEVAPYSINGNIDCFAQQLITKPELRSITPPFTVTQNEESTDGCLVHTSYGVVDNQSTNIQLLNTNIAGPVSLYVGNGGLVGIPNSSLGLIANNSGYLEVIRDVRNRLKSTPNLSTHQTAFRFDQPSDFPLADSSGTSLKINYDSMSFSNNGQWMIINAPGIAVLRVNLANFEVIPFAPAFDYGANVTPNPQTAVTNDGRFAVVGSSTFGFARLYDISTCSASPAKLIGPASCQSRDIWKPLSDNISGFVSLSTFRFIDNNILSVYGGHRASPTSPINVSKYVLLNTDGYLSQLAYLALGDSFSSGEGAYSYNIGTDTNLNRCHVSTESYPDLITASLHLNSAHNIACSGAKFDDVTTSSLTYKGQATDGVSLSSRHQAELLAAYTPGYLPQLAFTTHYMPQNQTITISGNNLGFSDIIIDCVANIRHPSCYHSYEDRLEVFENINAQAAGLTSLLADLKRQANPGARIYAVGYPQIVAAGGNCAVNVHLDSSEITFAIAMTDKVNDMIEAAAKSAGVAYIDVTDAFAGHRLCETKSDDVAVNGLTFGNDIPRQFHKPLANESFHPNKLGQHLLAKAVLQKTSNFTLSSTIKPKATTPNAAKKQKLLETSTKSGKKVTTLIKGTSLPKVIKAGKTTVTKIAGTAHATKPNSTYTVTINGQNTQPVISDATGDIVISITPNPTNTDEYQSIDVTGPGADGQDITIHQPVYVETDTPPSSSCNPIPSSGVDADHDNLDDACDDFIGAPPTNTATDTSSRPSVIINTGQPTTTTPVANPTSNTTTSNSAAVVSNPNHNVTSGTPTISSSPKPTATLVSSQLPVKATNPAVLAAVSDIPSAAATNALSDNKSLPDLLWLLLTAAILAINWAAGKRIYKYYKRHT